MTPRLRAEAQASIAEMNQQMQQQAARVAAPTEHPEVTRLKDLLKREEAYIETLHEERRANRDDAENAWRRRLEPAADLPGVKNHMLTDEVVVPGKLWRAWRSDRSQREMFLADECGRLQKRAEDAERERDAAQAKLMRLERKR